MADVYLIQTPTQWNLIGLQHDRPTACVIAQQYSPATFLSLRFDSTKKH
jgi:hypothetical protein